VAAGTLPDAFDAASFTPTHGDAEPAWSGAETARGDEPGEAWSGGENDPARLGDEPGEAWSGGENDPARLGDEPAERFGLGHAARGVLLAVLAQAVAGCLVLCVAAGRLLASGHDGLSLDRGSTGPLFLACGFGFATAAALIAGNGRAHRLRHTTIVIALTLAAAWPLSGFAIPAALLATVAIGLAAAYDRFRPPSHAAPPVPAGVLLAIVGAGLMISGLAGARTRDLHPRPAPTPDGKHTVMPQAGTSSSGLPATPTPESPNGGSPEHPATPVHGSETAPGGEAPTPDAKTAPTPDSKSASPTPDQATAAPTPDPKTSAPAPTATPAPAAPAPVSSPPGGSAPLPTHGASADAAGVVSAYYQALDGRRFGQAWKQLSPAVQKAFGGFAHWKAGFASTLESRPEQIVAGPLAGGGFSVRHVLVARDKTACGPVEQRFKVTWRLTPTAAGGLTAASLHAAALGRPAPNCR
jgi:hypothetical protein